jgi:hypothetical protein
MNPSARANWPFPPSTLRTTVPCLRLGSGHAASRPSPAAAKADTVPVAELDRACVLERRLLAERELCLESRIAAWKVLEGAVNSVRIQAGYKRRARRG